MGFSFFGLFGQTNKFKTVDAKEFATFIEEIKCFSPDIIILQAINSISEAEIEQIKQAVKGVAVYKLTHPSTRKRGGRIVHKLIIDPLREQGYKEETL